MPLEPAILSQWEFLHPAPSSRRICKVREPGNPLAMAPRTPLAVLRVQSLFERIWISAIPTYPWAGLLHERALQLQM